MAIVSEQLAAQLKERFAETLAAPLELRLHVRPGSSRLILPSGVGCQTCEPFREIAEALVDASADKLSLTILDDYEGEVPLLEVTSPGQEARIRFQGLPAGLEFAALLETIEHLSGGDSGLSPDSLASLEGLKEDLELMVFVTPTCPYCPGAVTMANRMAMASEHVRAVAVEANEFPALSQRFGVRGVPQTVVNQSGVFVGALPEAEFLGRALALVSQEVA